MDIPRADPGSDRVLIASAVGYLTSAAVGTAAQLGIADRLASRPRTAADLAHAVGADTDSLLRMLRFLSGADIVHEDEAGYFHLTTVGRRLTSSAPWSLRDAVIFLTQGSFWQSAGRMTDAVRSGRPQFQQISGSPFWEYLRADPVASAEFHAGMACLSGPEDSAIADTYDCSGVTTVADIGGGRGGLLFALLERNPWLRGVLHDREEVLAEHIPAPAVPASRYSLAAGDFFTDIPPGGDLYVLKHILLDWDDDDCVRILTRCRDAMPAGARILVAETIRPAPGSGSPGWVGSLDMLMMILLTGRTRTREQYERLFDAAGLVLTRVVPTETFSALSLLEARPK